MLNYFYNNNYSKDIFIVNLLYILILLII